MSGPSPTCWPIWRPIAWTSSWLPTPETPLRRSLESWFRDKGIQPRLVAEFDDPSLMKVLAAEGFGFFPLPDVVLRETMARYGVRQIGRVEECRQEFYAISAERRLVHPTVVAITSRAQVLLSPDFSCPARTHSRSP